MLKRMVSLLLCAALILGALPLSAGAAADTTCAVTFHYEQPDGTETTTKLTFVKGDSYQSKLTIDGGGNHLPPHNGKDKTFLGWYNATQPAQSGLFPRYINLEDICSGAYSDLYAWYHDKLSADQYAVVYDYNIENYQSSAVLAGDIQQYKIMNKGDPVGSLPVPKYDGYTFAGWWNNDFQVSGSSYYQIDKTFVPTMTGVVISLRAGWVEENNAVSLTLDANGGTFPNGNNIISGLVLNAGEDKYLDYLSKVPPGTDPYTPQKSGCTFAGWYLDKACSDGMDIDSSLTPSANVPDQTLYAKWLDNTSLVTLTIDKGNNSGGQFSYQGVDRGGNFSIQVAPGTTFTDALKDVTATSTDSSLILEFWSSTNGPSYTRINMADAITSNTTIYAVWATYATLTLKAPGAAFTRDGITTQDELVITVPKPKTFAQALSGITVSKSGSVFDYWKKADGSKLDDTVYVNSDTTLEAVWKAPSDTVTFTVDPRGGQFADGSTAPKAFTVSSNTLYRDALAGVSLTLAGGYFMKWVSGLGVLASDLNLNRIISEGDTVYAQWGKRITFRANGGRLGNGSDTFTFSQPSAHPDSSLGDNYQVTFFNHPNMNKNQVSHPDGKSFLGWTKAADDPDTLVTGDTMVQAADGITDLYALWGDEPTPAQKITLKLDFNGGTVEGSADKTIQVPSDITFAQLKSQYIDTYTIIPPQTNSTLGSWYITVGQPLEDTATFQNNDCLHLAWITGSDPAPGKITVSFDTNCEDIPNPNPQEYDYPGNYGQLPQLTREGYNFLGWFTEKAGGTEAKSNGEITIGKSHTLYAHWGLAGAINLNPDGGALGEDDPKSVAPEDGKYPELPEPTRPGYTFQGWFTAQKDSGTQVKKGDTVTPADIGMIYAHWKANTYAVAFDLNYTGAPAAPANKTVTYDQTYGPLPQPDRSGYTFLGWFTQPSGGLEVKAEDKVQITEKQTLFAHWQEGDPVTLELQGGKLPEGVSNKIGVIAGGSYPELPVPTRTGYTFEGWFTKAEEGTKVESGGSVGEKAPEKLYAHWTPRKVTVNFDFNGAPGSRDPKTYNYGAKYANLPAARWDGHTFLGWFTAAEGGSQITKDSTISVPEGTDESEGLSITLYARWGFQISYEANGGSGEMASGTAPMDSSFTLPSCSFTPPDGLAFDRWAVGSAKGEKVPAGGSYTFNRNTTLYALWKEAPVTITATCTSGGSLATASGQSGAIPVDKGQDMTFHATANRGYELVDLIVDGESLYALESYTFRSVAEDHTIHAVFQRTAPDGYLTCPRDHTCPLSNFTDLDPKEWYHDAVHYCLDEVIMNGVDSRRYMPNKPTSRAMLTMALWRAEGRPDAVGNGSLTRPYKDVPSTEWFYRPIVWATRTGVVNGYSATAFGPNDNITREQVVTILWRHAGSPTPRSQNLPFYDDWATSSYAWNAMCWAYENGIINGRPNRILDPRGKAKRVEIAEMMKNYLLNFSDRG